MITQRQEKLLDFLVKEYIATAEPVSSNALKKVTDLDVCGATIRNDLQALTKQGYIEQPHTSAGRIPTEKAYQHFAQKLAAQKGEPRQRREDERAAVLHSFIMRQVREAHEEMEREMRHMQEIMQALEQDDMFNILNILDKWHKNQI